MPKTTSETTSEYYSEVCHCSKCESLRAQEKKKTKKIKAKEKR